MTIVTPWYEKTLWIIVWLIVFWPVAIYGMWKSSRAMIWKIIVTLLVVGPTILGILSAMQAPSVGN
ncbi:MAG: hypothetical protein EBS29_10165 [Chloroflexia bacterium]|nr:hypothetical protein [Chloroflexia bacterium]